MLDAELGAAAGSHGGQVDVMAANVTCPRESFHSISYSRVSRGLMVNVSWNGVRCLKERCCHRCCHVRRVWSSAAPHGVPGQHFAHAGRCFYGVASCSSTSALLLRGDNDFVGRHAGVGVRVDKEANELLYGEGTLPAAILHGDVAQPQNLMAPLLKVCSKSSCCP